MCFHLICICHVYVPMQILGDQKDYRFSSTQLMIFSPGNHSVWLF